MFILLAYTLFAFCVFASTKPGSALDLIEFLKSAPKDGVPLSSLPLHHYSFTNSSLTSTETLLACLHNAVSYHLRSFLHSYGIKSLAISREKDRLVMNEADKHLKHLWQVFVPGSVSEEKRVGENVPVKIVQTYGEIWAPLRHNQTLFSYKLSEEAGTKNYTFKQPPTAKVSYLVNPIEKEMIFGSLDTPICLLHIFDCTPRLNHGLIREINKGVILRVKGGVISVIPKKTMKSHESQSLMERVGRTPFLGEFSRNNIDKQLVAGFIPRLENYYSVNDQQMQLLVKNIVRSVIGKHVGISFLDDVYDERSELAAVLHMHFSSFLPGSNVRDVPHSNYGPAFGLMINDGLLEGVVLYAGIQYSMILEFPCQKQRVNNLTILQHVSTQNLTFPNLISFKNRRFSGLSSVMYNSTRQSIQLRKYQPLFKKITLQVAFKLSTNGNTEKLGGLSRDIGMAEIILETQPWLHFPRLVVLPLIYIDSGAILAYDVGAIYIARVPMVLQILEDGTIWSIVARHVDEPELTMEGIIAMKPFN